MKKKNHQILGIPKTGIYLSTVNECEEDNEIIAQWKQQHPEVTKSQQTLCELTEASDVADEMFVLNFITLFVNTMIEKKSCGGLQTSITMKIAAIKKILDEYVTEITAIIAVPATTVTTSAAPLS